MHGHLNVKFVNAKQAEKHISIGTQEKNTKPTRQYGVTKCVEKNSYRPTIQYRYLG